MGGGAYKGGGVEAAGGIEPPHRGFADLCLTAWLRRLASRKTRALSIGIKRARWTQVERETGFEPATPTLARLCSSQLSYSRAVGSTYPQLKNLSTAQSLGSSRAGLLPTSQFARRLAATGESSRTPLSFARGGSETTWFLPLRFASYIDWSTRCINPL